MKLLQTEILSQKNILERLSIFRMTFSLLLVHTLITERSTFDFIFFFDSIYFNTSPWYYPIFDFWFGINLLLLLLNFMGYQNKIVKVLLAFFLIPYLYYLNNHLRQVTQPIWYYSAFWPIFIFIQIFAKTDYLKFNFKLKLTKEANYSPREVDYFSNSFFKFYIINMFYISAISKTVISGSQWFWNADYIKTHTLLAGTAIGLTLVRSPILLQIMGISTLLFEAFGWFIFRLNQQVYAICALIFHMSTWAIMDINFVLLWPLYIPIFFELNGVRNWCGRLGLNQ